MSQLVQDIPVQFPQDVMADIFAVINAAASQNLFEAALNGVCLQPFGQCSQPGRFGEVDKLDNKLDFLGMFESRLLNSFEV